MSCQSEPLPAPARDAEKEQRVASPPWRGKGRDRSADGANPVLFDCTTCKRSVLLYFVKLQQQGQPSMYHAIVVIFLEFFAWGLLTTPVLTSDVAESPFHSELVTSRPFERIICFKSSVFCTMCTFLLTLFPFLSEVPQTKLSPQYNVVCVNRGIYILHETFSHHTFLMNGIIQGVKCSTNRCSIRCMGKKMFSLLTVFFTCAPIPLMRISPWWYFAMISISGIFSVTFSVIFAYVADITQEHERTTAYGLVSATFAASLVSSPAIGAYLSASYGDNLVVIVATLVAVVDICFILLAVPESLPEKMRPASWGASISWEQADPFASLEKVGKDSTVLPICITVFLSYLPEAGQYSSFFLYLRQVIGFGSVSIAAFVAVVGIGYDSSDTICFPDVLQHYHRIIIESENYLSWKGSERIIESNSYPYIRHSQHSHHTVFLSILMRSIGNKNAVLLGLGFQLLQLAWYGFGSQFWMMWAAGAVAAMSSITFPAISALVSQDAEPNQQGVVQGIITGVRGLCNGLGPALYGFIFYLFNVELNELPPDQTSAKNAMQDPSGEKAIIPGPRFLVGTCIVLLAFLVALFIPERNKPSSTRKHCNSISSTLSNNTEQSSEEDTEPLLQDSSV